MKRTLVIATATALLLAVPVASAKRINAARVCGATECRALDEDGLALEHLFPGGAVTAAPEEPGERYRATLTYEAGRRDWTLRLTALLGEGLVKVNEPGEVVGGSSGWYQTTLDSAEAWRRATRGIEPLPARAVADADRADHSPAAERTLAADRSVQAGIAVDAGTHESGGPPWGWIAASVAAVGLLCYQLRGVARRRAGRR